MHSIHRGNKRNPFLALLVLCALTFSACMSTSDTTLRAGAAETVITPEVVLKSLEGVKWIGAVGDGHYVPKEDELMPVYDDLYARALVLADDRQRLAIVTLDITALGFPYIKVLLGAINKATGIPKENIAINTSHTHNVPVPGDTGWKLDGIKSDPYFWSKDKQASTVDVDIPYDEWLADSAIELSPCHGGGAGCQPDCYQEWLGDRAMELSPYYEWLAGHIAATVKIAADNLQSATLRVGRAPVQIGYNRRLAINPEGVVVPWVDVLGAYGEDGKRIAVLFSHAAHPVIIMDFDHRPSHVHTVIGPDYPGYAIKHLRNLLFTEGEPEGVFMFAQGCGANINGFPLRGGFEASNAAGLSLAFAVTRALADGKNVASAPLKARSLNLSLPHVRLSVAECKEWLSEYPNNGNLKRLLERAESGEVERSMHYPMSAFSVGDDLCILSLPSETFAEYQLFADETSPFKHTLVFGYTNGINSGTGSEEGSEEYVATKKDLDLGLAGGYEASARYRWPLEPSTEQSIQEGITRLLSELESD